ASVEQSPPPGQLQPARLPLEKRLAPGHGVARNCKMAFPGRPTYSPQAFLARRSTSPAFFRARLAPSARISSTRFGLAAYSSRLAWADVKKPSPASARAVLTWP